MSKCIVPGTFDPITKGHMDVIKRASKLFDSVVVGIALSKQKNPKYDIDKRVEFASKACSELINVKVKAFDGLLVDFLKSEEANCVVKGLRNNKDFEYEANMAAINKKLFSEFETIYFLSDPKNVNISSTQVRELESMGVDCSNLLP